MTGAQKGIHKIRGPCVENIYGRMKIEGRKEFMGERYLVITEVSQKQAYVFSSNKLKDNVTNSEAIRRVTSEKYLRRFSDKFKIVSEGGGHTILEFEDLESAKEFNQALTAHVLDAYPHMELYAKVMEYNKEKPPGDNLKELVRLLEIKKAERRAAFHQGTFGIEKIDRNTMLPELPKGTYLKDEPIDIEGQKTGSKEGDESGSDEASREAKRMRIRSIPRGFKEVFQFENLANGDDDANFIAVVHVDGNGFGKRVSDFYASRNNLGWDEFRTEVRKFSDGIDDDFKDAYSRLAQEVADYLVEKEKKEKEKDKEKDDKNKAKTDQKYFPMRRIISSGDDVCFVTEGKIGVECAARYLQILSEMKNKEDEKGYSACAGVVLIHKKFPFYKAYELSERLCSNAKSFGSELSPDDQGKEISSIDWHIEYGEMPDTLDDIRRDFRTKDGGQLELRPFIVAAPDAILSKEKIRQYDKFRKLMSLLDKEEGYASGKLKQMRSVLKNGENSARYFLKFHKIEDLAMESYHEAFEKIDASKVVKENGLSRQLFVETQDGKKRSVLFDAVELLGNYEIIFE